MSLRSFRKKKKTLTNSLVYIRCSELLKGAHLKSIQKQERAEIDRRFKQTVSYADYEDATQS